ncbi:hypothetical protein F2Q68_00009128 [Brassica cretica]|uniref:S1 motif domain-containing protein n=1 Tax=Brassica cretica TaxID=69181 RepID=A0A8S9L1H2_BRACR|nr:hypothetical protein F2Q68_00009128 [Brassica cretica]
MEGLKLTNAELMVYIHPSKSGNKLKAICRELSSLLFQYDETFDGVLLAFDVTVKSKGAKILAGLNPYFGVKRNGEDCFVSSSHKRHVLKVGTMLRLQVESFDEEVMHIAGSLLPANTGCVKWLEKQSEEALHMDRGDHKRRKIA